MAGGVAGKGEMWQEGRGKGRGRVNRGALSLSHITQRYVRRVRDRA